MSDPESRQSRDPATAEVSPAGGGDLTPDASTSREEPATLAPFHVVGRFDERDPAGPRFGWPGTEIRARFSGSALGIELADTGESHYDLTVDGGPPALLVVAGERRAYDLARGLEPGVHDVVLTKRTESFTGTTQLYGFVGTLVPSPAPAGRRIEFIGDSITCGYGVLGESGDCDFSAATESEPAAWGALAAKTLGAIHMATAVSGIGVLRSYDGSTSDTMPKRYDRALADDPTSVWAHARFEPDLVVVNLGTNDFAGGKGDPGAAFQTAYALLLADVRAKHARAWIVATTSPMLSDRDRTLHRLYLEGALAARRAAGDTELSFLDLDEQMDHEGYGCSYHPSATTHRRMGAALVDHVRRTLRW